MSIQPYLFFDGRAEEAAEFYKQTLGAEIVMMMRFSESPDPNQCAPGMADKIMHMSLRIGGTEILASDGECKGKASFQGFGLAYSVPSVEEAGRIFGLLGEGGQIQMPMMQTFFSPSFGMVADRFGVTWMIMADRPAQG
jgi:PhnB protein